MVLKRSEEPPEEIHINIISYFFQKISFFFSMRSLRKRQGFQHSESRAQNFSISLPPHLSIPASFPPFISPSPYHPIPLSPHLSVPLFITKNGAWLEVNTGGSLLRIDAIAGCLLNSLSKNCLINGLLHPFG